MDPKELASIEVDFDFSNINVAKTMRLEHSSRWRDS